jgi:putative polyhydroxyalkanoate system protein
MGKKISINRKHGLGLEGANAKLHELGSQFAAKYGVTTSQSGSTVNVSGSGVTGSIGVTDNDISVDLELGFAAGMFAGKIEDGLKTQLEKHFG